MAVMQSVGTRDELLPSRRTFFEHLRALMQYMFFDNWEHLMRFMLDNLEDDVPD